MKREFIIIILSLFSFSIFAQKVQMEGTASLEQVYGEQFESETLLTMNDMDIDFGYVLYQAEVTIESGNARLEFENVRDYAAIYANGELQGTATDSRKKLTLPGPEGKYLLQCYVENIGRITYGPEILDNSKGLFGSVTLDGKEIENWTMIELRISDCDVNALVFTEQKTATAPCFYKGGFALDAVKDVYLDITGWGMGEVWINGQYMGSYWEEEKQQSIQVPASVLVGGRNEVIVFELKNNNQASMQLSDAPVFK